MNEILNSNQTFLKYLICRCQKIRSFKNLEIIKVQISVKKEICDTLLEVINYLHKQRPQILHFDLHPGNIVLTIKSGDRVAYSNKCEEENSVEVKLAHFELAKICEFAEKSYSM